MIADPISQTARWTAAARAREGLRPQPIVVDPYAERLAGPEGFALLDRLSVGGENPYIVVRTRYLDGLLLREAVAGRQVVLMAAGLDARAWRLDWAPGVTLFELDRPEVLAEKAEKIGDVPARCRRVPVRTDLLGPWESALLAAGYDPSVPAVWVVEGLVVYLEAAAVDELLDRARGLAAPGSRLFLDFPALGFLRSPFTAELRAQLAALGAPWRFGSDDPEGLLAARGWAEVRVVRPGEPEAHFGRWPWPTPPRGMTPMENYLVSATAPG